MCVYEKKIVFSIKVKIFKRRYHFMCGNILRDKRITVSLCTLMHALIIVIVAETITETNTNILCENRSIKELAGLLRLPFAGS